MRARINTSVKGRNNELLVVHMMERAGFSIAFRSVRTRFQAIDYAGLFDVVGVKACGEGSPVHWYASSKTNKHYDAAHIEALMRWKYSFAHKGDIVELYDFHDSKWIRVKGSKKKALRPKTAHIKTFEIGGCVDWQMEMKSG